MWLATFLIANLSENMILQVKAISISLKSNLIVTNKNITDK
jgi:hypothetical protein